MYQEESERVSPEEIDEMMRRLSEEKPGFRRYIKKWFIDDEILLSVNRFTLILGAIGVLLMIYAVVAR